MRMLFGVVSLLIALAVVGLLAKKQMTEAVPKAADGLAVQAVPGGSPQVQSQQLQAQVKAAVDAAMQQKRPELDDK